MTTPDTEFGSIFDPLVDVATSVVHDVGSVVSSVGDVVGSLPGGNLIVDAANQGAQWVTDIANTPTGNVVLRALATALYGPLASNLGLSWFGPQIASVVWALPGLARGDDFMTAWVQEFAYRASTTAQYLGGEAAKDAFDQVAPTIKELLAEAERNYPGLDPQAALDKYTDIARDNTITPEALAEKLGIRQDVAALAIQYAAGKLDIYPLTNYPVQDPMDTPLFGPNPPKPAAPAPVIHGLVSHPSVTPIGYTYEDMAKRLATAKKDKAPQPIINALQAQLNSVKVTPVNISRSISRRVGANAVPVSPKTSTPTGTYSKAPPPVPPKQLPKPTAAQPTDALLTPESGLGAAGGAAAGFAVGGPIGAAVGAVGGFIAGHFLQNKI